MSATWPTTFAVSALAFALAGCGASAVGRETVGTAPGGLIPPSPGVTGPSVAATTEPEIDWDHPLANGIPISVAALDSPAATGLSFTPIVPKVTARLKTLEVTDPSSEPAQGRGVAWVFDFTGDPRFTSDARVYVNEEPARGTEAELEAEATNPPGPPQDFSLQHVGPLTILLIQDHGVGLAEFIQNGIDLTVTGPAVPPPVVMQIASALGGQS